MFYNFSIVVAIDFGNDSSGYAYCFSPQTYGGDIYTNDWQTLVGQRHPYIKTPTCLLYKGKNLELWGYKAKRKFQTELFNQNNIGDYHFFENFRNKLFYRPNNQHGEPYIEDNGERFLITDLVADYLREIRLIALQDISDHFCSEIDETQICWCLTVPANWDDAAKQLMEQAAKKAGILKENDWEEGRFLSCSEPEAICIYCLYVAYKEVGMIKDKSTMLIVDCGGGTVDLTVHEIVREGREKGLREIIPGSGAADGHGGKDVDKDFLNYLAKVLGGGAIDKFERDYPEAYVQMMDDWENLKCGDIEEVSCFPIPKQLRNLLQTQYPNVLQELAKNQTDKDGVADDYSIWLTRKVMEDDIFSTVVNNILIQIENIFKHKQIDGECDYLFLTGSFATSRFLQQRIKEKFSNHVRKKIVIPGEPAKAIMMGAVAFARPPETFRVKLKTKEISVDNSFSIAIAIDFGTTFSGYAYCFSAHTSEGDIYKNTDWNISVGQKSPYVKTPTHLLYNGKNFDSWGYKAKQRLIELRQKNTAGDYHFFEKFKTKLFNRTEVNEQGEPYIEDNGERFLLIDLIADYLREMRLMALRDVTNHAKSEIDETQIRWCLTVPAIWDDAAKQLMEQAAKKAGVLKDGDWDAERFMFALEPESAALYCMYVADKELGTIEDKSTMLIVDCGGGTVDLTVHEIVREGREKGLREIIPGSGAADGHGGKDVDKNFLNYLAKVLGGSAINKFEAQYPKAYLQMMDEWENSKCGPIQERLDFPIPAQLRNLLQNQYRDVLKELAKNQTDKYGESDDYTIWITRKIMEEEIFGSVVNNILIQIENIFKHKQIAGKCDYLHLVGGFATSHFLQQQIKARFSNHVKKRILMPAEPGKTIMMGAAFFARNPEFMLPRKSRLTYGVATSISDERVLLLMSEFLSVDLPSEVSAALQEIKKDMIRDKDSKLHQAINKAKEMGDANFSEHLKNKIDTDRNERLRLSDLFTTFITFGETVIKNHAVPQLFSAADEYQQEATIRILATKKTDVFFADEEGVEQIGQIDLKLPPIEGERRIKVTMYFGDTRLKVKAKSLESDHEVEAELDFITGYMR